MSEAVKRRPTMVQRRGLVTLGRLLHGRSRTCRRSSAAPIDGRPELCPQGAFLLSYDRPAWRGHMSDSQSSWTGTPPPDSVVREVQPFDPGPSVAAAVAALQREGAQFALIGGLALDAWGIPRATKRVDFAVPVGIAEKAAERLRASTSEIRPLRIGGVGLRDTIRGLRIDLVDRRFPFRQSFREP